MRAQVNIDPVHTIEAGVTIVDVDGVVVSVVLPRPSCPFPFCPLHHERYNTVVGTVSDIYCGFRICSRDN